MSSEKNSASLKTEQSDEVRKLQFKICSENEMLKFGQTVAKELFPGAFIAMSVSYTHLTLPTILLV